MALCCEEGYDILINATSASLPIAPDHILPHTLVMDITTRPRETAFLKHAQEKGCSVIYGYEMFIEQALGQFDLWFTHLDLPECRTILEGVVPSALSRD